MKKLLITAALALALATAAAHASIWDSAATSNWSVKPTKKYKLDMYGYDARAYEFVTDNGLRCVAVFPGGNSTGWQLQCLPIQPTNQTTK